MKQIGNTYFNRVVKCPQCQNHMADLGLDFKIPPMNDDRKWKIIGGLFKIGKSGFCKQDCLAAVRCKPVLNEAIIVSILGFGITTV